MNVYEVIRRPLITEKGHDKREQERTLCFEVHPDANKIQIRTAVETVFKVKVADVRTSNTVGKLRRRGRFSGYGSDWKKAYVRRAKNGVTILQRGQRNRARHGRPGALRGVDDFARRLIKNAVIVGLQADADAFFHFFFFVLVQSKGEHASPLQINSVATRRSP